MFFDRYVKTARKFKADIIVRITSDCPLVDPKILDKMIKVFKKKNLEYFTNVKDPSNSNDKFSIQMVLILRFSL